MTTYSPSAATTSYAHSNGQLTSVTDSNSKTISYLYNYAGQVACEAYPVASSSSCGTLSAPGTPSTTNTIVDSGFDSSGRLSSTSDWLGSETTYTYGNANFPDAVTKITYPSSTSLTANYTYDADGNLTGLTAGSSISDAWTYNADEQVATTKINGATSASVAYNANTQITGAANLATSTSNDTYTVAANGEITKDVPPTGTTYSYAYNAGDEPARQRPVRRQRRVARTPPPGRLISTRRMASDRFRRPTAGAQRVRRPTTPGTPTASSAAWRRQLQRAARRPRVAPATSTTGTGCG